MSAIVSNNVAIEIFQADRIAEQIEPAPVEHGQADNPIESKNDPPIKIDPATGKRLLENGFPGFPVFVVLESPIRRCCDAVSGAIDKPRDAAKALAMLPAQAASLLHAFARGPVSQDEKLKRDAICKHCPDCRVAGRFVGTNANKRAKLLGYYCNACTCGIHPLSELTSVKNWLRNWECPKGRHPSNLPRAVLAWQLVRRKEIQCLMPAEFGCGCGIKEEPEPSQGSPGTTG